MTVMSVDPGAHTVRIQYTRHYPTDAPFQPPAQATAKIWSIRVSGVTEGGAYECTPCAPGYHAAHAGTARCTPCSAGHSSVAGATKCTRCKRDTFAPFEGSPECTKCGANTYSLAGSTECAATCAFADRKFSFGPPPPMPKMDKDGGDMDDIDPMKVMMMLPEPTGTLSRQYDLAPLRDAAQTYTLTVPVANPMLGRKEEREVVMSICNPLPPSAPCMAPAAHLPPHTYACSQPAKTENPTHSLANTREVLALGSLLSFDRLQLNLQHRYQQGVTVRYDLGDACEVQGGTAGLWSVVLHIVCNLDAGVGAPRNASDEEVWKMVDGPCQVHLIWETQHGCVVCKDEDYEVLGGACVAGVHDVSYSRSKLCFEGQHPPPPEKGVPCRDQVMASLSPAAFWALTGGLSFVAVTIGTLGCCYLRYKSMYGQYSQVLASDDDGSMPYGSNTLEEDAFGSG